MKKTDNQELQQLVNNFTRSISILEYNFSKTHNITVDRLHKMQHKNRSILSYVFYGTCVIIIISRIFGY